MSRADPSVVKLYRQFERLVRKCGPVTVSPVKTSVGFKVRTTFAGVRLEKDGLRVGLLLGRRLASPRFVKVQSISPRNHEHVFRFREPKDLDSEVQSWLRVAYQVGQQLHLRQRRDAETTSG